jgi:hypothetical protein
MSSVHCSPEKMSRWTGNNHRKKPVNRCSLSNSFLYIVHSSWFQLKSGLNICRYRWVDWFEKSIPCIVWIICHMDSILAQVFCDFETLKE